jgi:uncharacterized OsmC-like protein
VSQVATKKKLKISNERVTVTAYFHEQGSVVKGDAEGFCDSFDIEMSLESSESEEEIANLIRLSRKMCFTEKALTGSASVNVSQKLNQQPLIVD